MAVVRNDATFVRGSKTTPLDYGQAEDCYSYVVTCKKIGTFHINTLGTKMKVNTHVSVCFVSEQALGIQPFAKPH